MKKHNSDALLELSLWVILSELIFSEFIAAQSFLWNYGLKI